jgi:hypothetical protein
MKMEGFDAQIKLVQQQFLSTLRGRIAELERQ